jgi:hypothetical protein
MWPAESFGGVSDEQFWDDMASDKPLATTARTAGQAAPARRRRLPEVVPAANGRGVDDRRRGDGHRIAGAGAGSGSGAYPQGGTQPTPVATRSYQPPTQPQPYQATAQSYQAPQSYQGATQPVPILGQGGRGGLPADQRGRGRTANGTDLGVGAAAGEDPLTSSAYSLRPRGAVDGRSYPSSRGPRDLPRDQYESAVTQETQSFSLADTHAASGGYPGGVPPFRQFDGPAGGGNGRIPESRPDGVRSDATRYDGLRPDPQRSDGYWPGGRTDPLRGAGTSDAYGGTAGHPYPERPYSDPAESASTPLFSQMAYGYPASPVDDPRYPNGTRGQGHSNGNGNGTGGWAARPPYPNGNGNGYRSPYDPRSNGYG